MYHFTDDLLTEASRSLVSVPDRDVQERSGWFPSGSFCLIR